MGRALEIVLLIGGSLCLALGLTWLGQTDLGSWTVPSLIAGGMAAIAGGIAYSLWREAKRAGGASGSLGVTAVDFGARGGPKMAGGPPGLSVSAHEDGTISLRVRGQKRAGLLACRAEGPCYFNTLSRSGRELKIKLVAPFPRLVRLELFDSGPDGN